MNTISFAMNGYRLRTDISRAHLGDFALPLGIEPGPIAPPVQGYTLTYNVGADDEPDTYAFYIVVSHERLPTLLERAFAMLPPRVNPIVEIDSYDAYRTVDVYLGREEEPIPREIFLATWQEFSPILLEDGSLGIGANSEEPFLEIFLDQWKGLCIHVPLGMREEVEAMLAGLGLHEVEENWPDTADEVDHAHLRPVLDLSEASALGLDDLLLELRRRLQLELNVDPERNLDDGGRELGMTLWHAALFVHHADDAEQQGMMSIWASARSLSELEQLTQHALAEHPEWIFEDWFSVTRVAFDERPDELGDLPPRRHRPEVHYVEVETNGVEPDAKPDTAAE